MKLLNAHKTATVCWLNWAVQSKKTKRNFKVIYLHKTAVSVQEMNSSWKVLHSAYWLVPLIARPVLHAKTYSTRNEWKTDADKNCLLSSFIALLLNEFILAAFITSWMDMTTILMKSLYFHSYPWNTASGYPQGYMLDALSISVFM